MQIKLIMTEEVEVIAPEASLEDAAKRMRSLDVGALPVCDGDRLVGVLTDRDLTIRSVAEGKDPRQTEVRTAMTPEITYCYEDQEVEEVERIMEKNQIRRIPVLNRDRQLVGIVSLGDFALKTDEHRVGETLERISTP